MNLNSEQIMNIKLHSQGIFVTEALQIRLNQMFVCFFKGMIECQNTKYMNYIIVNQMLSQTPAYTQSTLNEKKRKDNVPVFAKCVF